MLHLISDAMICLVFNCKKLDVPYGAITDVSADRIRFYCPSNSEVVWDVICIAGEWTPKHNISCIDGTALTTLPTCTGTVETASAFINVVARVYNTIQTLLSPHHSNVPIAL